MLDAAAVAQHLFSEAEAKAVSRAGGEERLRTFFQLWTLKEAALKSIGEGLAMGLDAFEFTLPPAPRVVRAPCGHGGPERFSAYAVEQASCCAAVVIRRNEPMRESGQIQVWGTVPGLGIGGGVTSGLI
jgi:4'-phosphopantetheinyl transferase